MLNFLRGGNSNNANNNTDNTKSKDEKNVEDNSTSDGGFFSLPTNKPIENHGVTGNVGVITSTNGSRVDEGSSSLFGGLDMKSSNEDDHALNVTASDSAISSFSFMNDNANDTANNGSSFSFMSGETSSQVPVTEAAQSSFSFLNSHNTPTDLVHGSPAPHQQNDSIEYKLSTPLANSFNASLMVDNQSSGNSDSNFKLGRVASTKMGVKKKKRATRVGFGREDGDDLPNQDEVGPTTVSTPVPTTVPSQTMTREINPTRRSIDQGSIVVEVETKPIPADDHLPAAYPDMRIGIPSNTDSSTPQHVFNREPSREPSLSASISIEEDQPIQHQFHSVEEAESSHVINSIPETYETLININSKESVEETPALARHDDVDPLLQLLSMDHHSLSVTDHPPPSLSIPNDPIVLELKPSYPVVKPLDSIKSNSAPPYSPTKDASILSALDQKFEKTPIQKFKLELDSIFRIILEGLSGLYGLQFNTIESSIQLRQLLEDQKQKLVSIEQQLNDWEEEQTKLALLEEFDKADALNALIDSAKEDMTLAQDRIKQLQLDITLLGSRFTDQRHSYQIILTVNLSKLQNTHHLLNNEVMKSRKESKLRYEIEEARLCTEQERIKMERSHARREEMALENDKQVTEEAIFTQTSDFHRKKTDVEISLSSVRTEIKQLKELLASKRNDETRLLKDLHLIDSRISDVKKKFDRQLQRIDDRKNALDTTKQECLQEEDTLKRDITSYISELESHRISSKALSKWIQTIGVDLDIVKVISDKLQSESSLVSTDVSKKSDILQSSILTITSSSALNQSTTDDSFETLNKDIEEVKGYLLNAKTEFHQLNAKLEEFQKESMKITEQIPKLESEKKAHATAKRFKEAANAAKELKELVTRKEEVEVKIVEIRQEVEGKGVDIVTNEEKLSKLTKDLNEIQMKQDQIRWKELQKRLLETKDKIKSLLINYQVKVKTLQPKVVDAAYSVGIIISDDEFEVIELSILLLQHEMNTLLIEVQTIKQKYSHEEGVDMTCLVDDQAEEGKEGGGGGVGMSWFQSIIHDTTLSTHKKAKSLTATLLKEYGFDVPTTAASVEPDRESDEDDKEYHSSSIGMVIDYTESSDGMAGESNLMSPSGTMQPDGMHSPMVMEKQREIATVDPHDSDPQSKSSELVEIMSQREVIRIIRELENDHEVVSTESKPIDDSIVKTENVVDATGPILMEETTEAELAKEDALILKQQEELLHLKIEAKELLKKIDESEQKVQEATEAEDYDKAEEYYQTVTEYTDQFNQILSDLQCTKEDIEGFEC